MNETNIPISKPAGEKVNENLNVPDEVKQALQADINKAAGSAPATAAPVVSNVDTEVIDLPSEGFFYSPESPLASGRLELKYMTAKEEDILTNQNLIKKGVVLDKLLEAMIVTPGVTPDDILIGDRNAIFVAARILAYGKKYDAKIVCPKCGAENEVSIDLTTMTNKEFDFTGLTRGVNQFEFKLPESGDVVAYKLLLGSDEKAIDTEIKSIQRINKGSSSEVTTRLKHLITSVNGDDKVGTIRAAVDGMRSSDALALRRHIKETSPDFDMSFNFDCEECGHEGRVPMPMGISFFWPDAGV
ncbi:MAG: T4 family baseplate hub assembly chaperone [Candidatus Ranarchaeia archaeon]|jgi:transcription elongation factor Elf1